MPRYCDSCGVEIPGGAVEAGKALKFEDSFYCEECKADVLPMLDSDPKQKARQKPEGFVKAVRSATAAAAGAGAEGARAKGERGEASPREAGRGATGGARGAAPAPGKPGAKRGADDPKSAKDGARAKGAGGSATGKGAAVRADKGAPGPERAARDKGAGARPARPGAERDGGRERDRDARGGRERGRDADAGAGASKGRRPAGSAGRGGREERRRSSGAGGSSEGDDAAPRKSSLPLPVLAGGGAALLILVIVIVVLATRDKGEAGDGAGATADGAPAIVDRETLKRRSQQAFADLKQKLGAEPSSFAAAIEGWEALVPSLEPVEAAEAQKEIQSLRERQRAKGEEALAEVERAVRGHVAEKRFQDALRALSGFPSELIDPTARRRLQDLRKLAELGAAGEREAAPLLAKAAEYAQAGDYRLAMGVLEGFDRDHYRDTAWAADIAERIARYETEESEAAQKLALERIAERERQRLAEAAAKLRKKVEDGDKWLARSAWEPWFGDDLFTFKFPEPQPAEAWKMKDRVLIGTAGAGQRGVGAITGVGSSEWKDYVFEVEYKVVKGGFKLGARFNKNRGAFVQLEPEIKKGGGWEKITISVRGRQGDSFQELLAGGGKRAVKFDAHDSSEGGICFVLEPHSEVHFRNLGVKVLPAEYVLD